MNSSSHRQLVRLSDLGNKLPLFSPSNEHRLKERTAALSQVVGAEKRTKTPPCWASQRHLPVTCVTAADHDSSAGGERQNEGTRDTRMEHGTGAIQ